LIGQTLASDPQSFSVEAWYKTSSATGGKLWASATARTAPATPTTGTSTSARRHRHVRSLRRVHPDDHLANATNDGQWHHVVGTYDGTSMKFYLDGVLVGTEAVVNAEHYTGYWRVGNDNLNGWPGQPSDHGLVRNGRRGGVYPTALTAGQVQTHYTAR
jgi:hypothetical protein